MIHSQMKERESHTRRGPSFSLVSRHLKLTQEEEVEWRLEVFREERGKGGEGAAALSRQDSIRCYVRAIL